MRSSRGILFLAAVFLVTAAALRPPVRQQELRVLITARNMVENRDPLHLEFQNRPRYRKPPFPYWAAAIPFGLTGLHQSVMAGRLFFVAGTVLMLHVLMRNTGENGLWAGICLLSTYGIWRFGSLAETDMLNILGIVLAFAGWEKRSGWLSATGMSVAFLSKGPAGLVIPLISFLVLQTKQSLNLRYWLTAVIPSLLCAGAWTGFLYLNPEARVALANELHDTFINTAHENPAAYYLYTLPLMMLPALLLCLAAPKQLRRATLSTTPVVWFAITFVLLTLTVSKQNHYALMLMPPAAWILGDILSKIQTQRSLKILGLLLMLATLAEIPRNRFEADAISARFLKNARPKVADAPMLHVVGVNSARFDFHLGRHVENTDSATHALNRAAPGDAILVVQRPEHFDAWEHPNPPLMEHDDDQWIRRMYRASSTSTLEFTSEHH